MDGGPFGGDMALSRLILKPPATVEEDAFLASSLSSPLPYASPVPRSPTTTLRQTRDRAQARSRGMWRWDGGGGSGSGAPAFGRRGLLGLDNVGVETILMRALKFEVEAAWLNTCPEL